MPELDTHDAVEAYFTLHQARSGFREWATDDVVLDLNVPRWRYQLRGADEIAEAFVAAFPGGLSVTHRRWEPTPSGAVVEYDGWVTDRDAYYRHLARLELRTGRIRRITVYCTGEWNTRTVDRQRREAPMVDREVTGATR